MMKASEWFSNELKNLEGSFYYEFEDFLLDIADQIIDRMEEKNISRAELARRLGNNRSYITKILSTNENLTLKTLYKVIHALDCDVSIKISSKKERKEYISEPCECGAVSQLSECINEKAAEREGKNKAKKKTQKRSRAKKRT